MLVRMTDSVFSVSLQFATYPSVAYFLLEEDFVTLAGPNWSVRMSRYAFLALLVLAGSSSESASGLGTYVGPQSLQPGISFVEDAELTCNKYRCNFYKFAVSEYPTKTFLLAREDVEELKSAL